MQKQIGVVFAFLAVASSASAQQSSTFKEQFKLIKAPNAVSSLGANLFGDQTNLYSGALEFKQLDVSLPGNNKLDVMVGRRLTAGRYAFDDRAFGKWDLEIPRLHGIFARGSISLAPGWVGTDGSNNRCASFGAPPEATGLQGSSLWAAEEFWRGNFMYIPGHGDQQLLLRNSWGTPAYTRKPTGVYHDGVLITNFPVVTSNHWQIACLSTMQVGSGQGFLAVSPDGTKYVFDRLVNYSATTLTKTSEAPLAYSTSDRTAPALTQEQVYSADTSGQSESFSTESNDTSVPIAEEEMLGATTATLPTTEVWILPSRVIDRFGNTVTYTYDPARPKNVTKISSSDGRVINITYVPDGAGGYTSRIQSVSDTTRTWTYAYDTSSGNKLSTVTLPDATTWQLLQADNLMFDPQYPNEPTYCTENIAPFQTVRQATLVHPTGATGSFTLTPTPHGRSKVPYACVDKRILWPVIYYTNSLTSKTISGPGLPSMTWSYQFDAPNGSFDTCTNCPVTEAVNVTDPEGNVSRHVFGNQYFINEGKPLEIYEGWSSGGYLRRTSISYRTWQSTDPYPEQFGVSDEIYGDGGSDLKTKPEETRTINQQGVDFTWRADAFDSLARPTVVTKFSGSNTRTETTTYFDNDAKWVIGQIGEITSGGKSMVKNLFDSTTLLPSSTSSFGIVQKSMTYNPDGTMSMLTEGRKSTKFGDYVRGTPQKVEYMSLGGVLPVYAFESSQINNLGNPTWSTDTEGNKTYYFYDAMGRLSKIEYPTDTPLWTSTTITFTKSTVGKYDLPAGHWKYQVNTGTGYVANYYDALWRPVYSEQWDSANTSGTLRVTKRSFDSNGKTTYESYPKRTFAEIGDGTHYQFDALGRTLVVGKNSELGMLYSGFNYNSGFVTEQVDARGNPTYFSYQAFDQPSQDSIVNISAPLSVNTAIARDNFGKALSITKSGGGKTATRTYIYDANERLCKTIEPETAGTIQQYDSYNAVAWKAVGQSTAASCDPATVLASAKTNFAYDHMNRLTTTTFGDGKPSISRTYTKDDLLETISSDGSVWTNVYNTRRQLKSETVTFGGATYAIQRGYDANANLANITYPGTGNVVDYAPNGLGEPSKAGTFATNVTYHPNGAIKSFTYGNGIVHTMTQNARGLPQRSTDDWGVLNDAYTYDANANVASITDDQMGVTTRTMTYDALDRLETVNAPNLWGMATYGYDSLDNITSTSITAGGTARVSTHTYNATTNLLSNISSNVPGYTQSYGYDTRGNITSRGSQGFKFDLANRLYEATLKGTYKYDGFGRRISTVGTDGVNRITVYSQDGKVMYGAVSGATTGTKYVYLHNHLIAESSPTYTQYDHTDGLGSPVATTNDSKTVVSRTRYEPYGATAAGTNPSIGFTGHVNAADIGLVYMQQRYYDPIVGRFLSVDPVTTDVNTAKSFNRYTYANNSPYSFVDPDGRESVGEFIDRKATEAASAGSHAATYGWALSGVAWKALGSEGISQIVDKGAAGAGGGVKLSAGLEVAAVLPIGKAIGEAAGVIKTGMELSAKQLKNVERFTKKLPVNARNSVSLRPLPNGGVAAQGTSPGIVPGSKAVYEKQIDSLGETVQVSKTTYDPQGNIVHVKMK